ncbi:MAG: exported protein of unknown function [Candidatus Saccharibacteria bacterium]|nr:exported protein of unknown function [Candidatus Saccharibacteria bacterium]
MNTIRTYLRSLGLMHYAILAAVAISAFTVSYYQISSADCYSGTVHGRTCYRGYFTNVYDNGGTFVLPTISNNQAIPTYINSVDELYKLIHDYYLNGTAQEKTGSEFIYNTMHGGNAPGTGRSISAAEWNDLYLRMKGLEAAGKINWTGNVSASVNTYYQGTDSGFGSTDGTNNDDAFYEEPKNESGIVFRDYNNNITYQILRRCANPMGENAGLPVARDYKLTPQINSVSPTKIEAGSKVSVNGSVDNEGNTVSDTTQWEITQITVKPGKKAPHEDENGTTSPTAPCQSNGGAASGNYFVSGDADCKNVAKGSGKFNLGTPAQNIKPSVSGLDVGDLPVGTRVCFALSVQPRSSASDDWAHSKPICTVVGKKPKVQIWGGDISVRGKIETSTSRKDVNGDKTFGSWVEYGAFSVGTNSKFASASGLNKGNDSNTQDDWSKLTFANANSTFGQYSTLTAFPAAPGIAAYFGSVQNTQPVGSGSVDVGNLTFDTGGAIEVRTAGDLTITGGNIPAGKSVVIIATGTVTIDGNITYTDDTLTSVRNIPQVVIIAANINIKDSVSRIDSWLITNGTINTCYNFSGNLTSDKCSSVLEVNGPVVTGKLVLNRTAGSDTDQQSGDPAERFNLRPDAFLWAQLQASGSNKAQTVYSSELPPRF